MQARYKRLGLNTFFVFVGKAGSSIISMLMLPFYTHWLSTDEYGTTDLINTYAMILMGLISCGIADSIFVFPKNAGKDERTKYYTFGYIFVAFTTIVCATVFYLLCLIGTKYNWSGVLYERLWFVLAFAICQFLQQYSQFFTRSIDKMKVFCFTGIMFTGSTALFSFFLLPSYGLDGYLYALILSNIFSTLFTILASKSYLYLSFITFEKRYLLEMLKYGFPLFMSGLMWWFINSLNRPVMEANLGLAAVGIYAVAGKFPSMLSILINVFGTAWSITVLEEFGKPGFNRFFNRTIKMLYFMMIVGCCLISAFSKVIVSIFAADSYYEAWKYVPVLTLSIVMQLLATNVGGVFMAEKKSKYFLYSNIWGALTSVFVTYVCIVIWGLQGAAIAVAFSCFIIALTRIIYAWKHINEMPVKWYCAMTTLCVIFIITVLTDLPTFINVSAFVTLLVVACLLSRDVLLPVCQTVKKILH